MPENGSCVLMARLAILHCIMETYLAQIMKLSSRTALQWPMLKLNLDAVQRKTSYTSRNCFLIHSTRISGHKLIKANKYSRP